MNRQRSVLSSNVSDKHQQMGNQKAVVDDLQFGNSQLLFHGCPEISLDYSLYLHSEHTITHS